MKNGWWQGGVAAIAVWLTTSGAQAQHVNDASRAAARDLGYAGVESYQAGDYETASAKLEKAYQVLKVPSLGLWSARALIKTNHWVEAAERLREVQRLEVKGGDASVQEQAQRDAGSELKTLTPRLPSLVIQIAGASASTVRVSLDGEELSSALIGVPLPANPGPHEVVGKQNARKVVEKINLVEHVPGHLELQFADTAPNTPPASSGSGVTSDADNSSLRAAAPAPAGDVDTGQTRRLVGWVVVGAGAAGVLFGATTGLLAVGKKKDLESDTKSCPQESLCFPNKRDEVDSYNSFRTLSSVGLIAGAALGAAGVIIVLTAPSGEPARTARAGRVWLDVSPRGGFVQGVF